MQCIKFPSVITYLITFNNGDVNGSNYVETNQEYCMPDSWTSEEFTNKDEYIQRCEELNIEPLLPTEEE